LIDMIKLLKTSTNTPDRQVMMNFETTVQLNLMILEKSQHSIGGVKISKMLRWPKLSRIALDILSIPAMSDELERVFSGARRTVSWERSQLDIQTLECIECLKHWKRSGILNEFLDK
jgi:asparagine synthetase A